MDLPGEVAEAVTREAGIDGGYFTAAPPAFKNSDRKKLLRLLETFLEETAYRHRRMA